MKKLLLNLLFLLMPVALFGSLDKVFQNGTMYDLEKYAMEHPEFDVHAPINGSSCLHFAAYYGNASLVSYLVLSYKVKVNTLDTKKLPPLFYAVCSNNFKTVELLLKNGAKLQINCKDSEGITPLKKAISLDNIKIVQILMRYKPSTKGLDKEFLNKLELMNIYNINIKTLDDLSGKGLNLILTRMKCLLQESSIGCKEHSLKNADLLVKFFSDSGSDSDSDLKGRSAVSKLLTSETHWAKFDSKYFKYTLYDKIKAIRNSPYEDLTEVQKQERDRSNIAQLYVDIAHEINGEILVIPSKEKVSEYLKSVSSKVPYKVIVIGGFHWYVIGIEQHDDTIRVRILDSFFTCNFIVMGNHLQEIIKWFTAGRSFKKIEAEASAA